MSKMNKPGPNPVKGPAPKIPAPPKAPAPTGVTNKGASNFLNNSDAQGAHNRSEHVGKSGQYLSNRVQNQVQGLKAQGKKVPATKMVSSYLGKADQNMGARSTMNSTGAQNLRDTVAKGGMNNKQAISVPQSGGRLKPIAKVSVMNTKTGAVETFNAKVDSNKMVLKKGPGGVRAQTSYPDKVTALPKPLPGGQVPANKVTVGAIGPGAQGQLRKVGAPAPKGPNLATDSGLGTQKRFGGMTKNATGVTKPNKK